ncbi:hypothetical protein [Corynebacterium matruchotii]|uniref:hypothetical protein n=1 Tax=Corynebacterium matruchotii TaxID=43768 RepID=UPI0021156B4E|nr:hypothetical protein [Corynebacterium matruchotii]
MSFTTGTSPIMAVSATTGTISAGTAVSSWEPGNVSGSTPPDATMRTGFMRSILEAYSTSRKTHAP